LPFFAENVMPYIPSGDLTNFHTSNFNPGYLSTTIGYEQTDNGNRVAGDGIHLKSIFTGFRPVLLKKTLPHDTNYGMPYVDMVPNNLYGAWYFLKKTPTLGFF
jgi:hypothetical protein